MSVLPSEFETSEIARIAEFFEGSIDEACAFVRDVWLPDAMITLHQIIRECDDAAPERLTFLCSRLHENARNVGASKFAHLAAFLYPACAECETWLARTIAGNLINRLNNYSLQLQRCA